MFAPGLKLGRAGGGRGDVCDPASEDGRAGVAAGEGEEGRISMLVIPENDNFGAGDDVGGEDCVPVSVVGLAGVEAGKKEERRRSRLEVPDDEAGGEYCVPASEVSRADVGAAGEVWMPESEVGRAGVEAGGEEVCVAESEVDRAGTDTGRGEEGSISIEEIPETANTGARVCVPLSTPGQAVPDIAPLLVKRSSVCVPRAEVSMLATKGSVGR